MELHVKTFDELTLDELYDLLRLRVDVFVVEQNCPYPELDGRDKAALHVFLTDEGGIQACLRVLDRGVASAHAALGRVIARRRGVGLGRRIVEAGIAAARERFGAETIYLEAQCYAQGFYEKLGFRPVSETFLEDGIPHVRMLLEAGQNENFNEEAKRG